jgi:pyruvate-formate lyase-activating enzyme
MTKIKKLPFLLYADKDGKVYEDTSMYMAGRSGWDAVVPDLSDFIEMPIGGSLYVLPDRKAAGFDVTTGEYKVRENGFAVAAFVPPAHTTLFLSAFECLPEAQTLPLFCYNAVGWLNNKFYVTAVRIDDDKRQDPEGFDDNLVQTNVTKLLNQFPENRLLEHIANKCALTYHCPAARNFFMSRYEAPIPTSPACNANCIGCISFQPVEEAITSTQDRLQFKPTANEIAEYTIPHLESVENSIISFGQGCEGEPLLMWETNVKAIKLIRSATDKGIININTNGSMPNAVEAMCKVGLQSIRVSMNSAQSHIYEKYYLPNNYKFSDLTTSIKIARSYGCWASINYFTFPGMTDTEQEYEALRKFIIDTDLCMIQWRNFNIDPDWYLSRLGITDCGETMGMQQMMKLIKDEFPWLAFGYFNPPKNVMAHYNLKRIIKTDD